MYWSQMKFFLKKKYEAFTTEESTLAFYSNLKYDTVADNKLSRLVWKSFNDVS